MLCLVPSHHSITLGGNRALFPGLQVAAGTCHTVGLRSDGTVVATGANTCGQLDVGSWKNIIQVTAGGYHTVGLRSDGTVVATGYNISGQLDVCVWTDIVQIAASNNTVGLKLNGTVVATGYNGQGQLDVGSWTNIVQVAAGDVDTIGLESHGTVVVAGKHPWASDILLWRDITQVASRNFAIVGLKRDGTVVTVGYPWCESDLRNWTNIVQVAVGNNNIIGLKSDGTVVAAGNDFYDQLNVGGWNLFPTSGELAEILTSAVLNLSLPKTIENSCMNSFRKVHNLMQNGKIIAAIDQREVFIKNIKDDVTHHRIDINAGNDLIFMMIDLIDILRQRNIAAHADERKSGSLKIA